MRQDKSSQLRNLGERVASLADQVAACIARAIELRDHPSAAVIATERDLWRWAHALRRAAGQDDPKDRPHLVAVALLIELDQARDLSWLGETIVRTPGPEGDGWRVRHVSARPDPASIFGTPDNDDPARHGEGTEA